LGVDQSSSLHETLDALSSVHYATPQGVRLIANSDPRYQPRGYHTGAVWPLFTGWVALALSRNGRLDEAWDLVTRSARLASERVKGAFDEVLDGETGAGAGVCPDQAWSAAAVLSPIVHGVLGIRPTAWESRCEVGVNLPVPVRFLRLNGVRVGHTMFDAAWRREDGHLSLTCTHRGGPALDLAGGDLTRMQSISADRRVVTFTH
jgi:glycogen debranching enzyme